MILRRMTLHIKNQNWFAVGLDIAVVILGVYIGIFVGNIQQEQQFKKSAYQNLAQHYIIVLQDIQNLKAILDSQQQALIQTRNTIVALDVGQPFEGKVEAMRKVIDIDNSTFFPNRSYYDTMADHNYLTALAAPETVYIMTDIYEHLLQSNGTHGQLLDQTQLAILTHQLGNIWNISQEKFIDETPNSKAMVHFQNNLASFGLFQKFYIDLIESKLLPAFLKMEQSIKNALSNYNTHLNE